MSDPTRIRISDLRAAHSTHAPFAAPCAYCALLDVVEAAHASTGPLSESLRSALDRFDFGDAQ